MSDEIFVSEKTGQRYKRIEGWIFPDSFLVKEIIEPKLEVGDTYTREFSVLKSTDHDAVFYNALEIRKADGEVWQKVNNEWRKK